MTWVALENGSGQTFSATICNLTENTVAFKDTTVIGMESAQYDSLEPSEKYEDAIDFTVCGSLTNHSTLEEIILLLGNPTTLDITLWYDDSGAYEYAEIEIEYCQADTAGSKLSFVLSGDGDYILSVSYDYRPS